MTFTPSVDDPAGTRDESTTSTVAPEASDAVATQSAPTGFAALGLPPELLGAVSALGFADPTPIQGRAVPALLDGRDLVGVAQTGTGKTLAFGLPLLASVDASDRSTQALILTPTRELAIQVSDAVASFVPAGRRIEVLPIYGGASFTPQLRGLERGAQVVVGTPGRVMDMLERRKLDLSTVRFVVLDEADEMLRMGFADDVETILAGTPASKQVALFSATMPPAIRRVADTHLVDPVEIAIARQSTPIGSVTQEYAVVPYRNKAEALARVLATSDAEAAIVFVRTRETAEEVGLALVAQGVNAASISGDVPQREREKIVERLREGALDVLVATDVAARGLDVERIGLVVNFDVPREVETYVHRIGRTGRAGRSGRALTFLTPKEKPRLRTIERSTGSRLIEATLPSRTDVLTHRLGEALGRGAARLTSGPLRAGREALEAYCAEHDVDVADLAAALLALVAGDDGRPASEGEDELAMRHDRNRSDRFEHEDRPERRGGWDSDRRGRERGGRDSRRDASQTRYRVAVGHRDGVTPQGIVGAITGEGGLRGSDIGRIDIFGSFSLVELPPSLDSEATRRIGAARVAGRQLQLRPDTGPRSGGRGNRETSRGERGEHRDRPRFERGPRDRFERRPRERAYAR